MLKGCRFILSIGPIAGPVILVLIVCIIFGGSIFSFSRFMSFDALSKIGEPEIHVAPVVSEIKKMNRIYLLKVLVGFFDKQVASEGKVKKSALREILSMPQVFTGSEFAGMLSSRST